MTVIRAPPDRHRQTLARAILQSCRLSEDDIDGLVGLAQAAQAIDSPAAAP